MKEYIWFLHENTNERLKTQYMKIFFHEFDHFCNNYNVDYYKSLDRKDFTKLQEIFFSYIILKLNWDYDLFKTFKLILFTYSLFDQESEFFNYICQKYCWIRLLIHYTRVLMKCECEPKFIGECGCDVFDDLIDELIQHTIDQNRHIF